MFLQTLPQLRQIVLVGILISIGVNRLSAQDPDSISAIRGKTIELIKQLGSDQYALRIKAEEQLSKYAPLIHDELLDALDNDDLEIASRAKAILSKFVKPNFQILDAMGAPIPFAEVEIHGTGTIRKRTTFRGELPTNVEEFETVDHTTYANSIGGVTIKEFDAGSVEISISHLDYGRGRTIVHFPLREKSIRFPLVESNSKAAGRSLTGIVKNEQGRPIAGALIHGFTVRTSGEGLINASQDSGDGLTNSKGEFRYYLPNNPSSERGKLIPLNSSYRIQVSIPGDTKNIPVSGRFNNQKNAIITFSLGNRVHRFAFETLDGKPPSAKELSTLYSISYHGSELRNPAARLNIDHATTGMKLKQGIYTASVVLDGRSISLQPIKVSQSSREKLTFRLPPRIEYRGRVIHGITRKPMKHSIVLGYDSQAQGSLAALTNDDWTTLSSLSAAEIMTDRVFDRLRKIYGIQAITKTNADGEFKINQPPGKQAYGLIAFDKNFVPYSMPYFHLLPKQEDPFKTTTMIKSLIKDFPLFPAAKVLVTPSVDKKAFSEKRISVMPVWIINPANQPKWFKDHFEKASHPSSGDFMYDHWLQHNEQQAVFVPAGLNLMLKLDTPYNEFVSPTVFRKPIHLKQGEVLDMGKNDFKPSLRAVVIVTDEKGVPIEGLPVRTMENGTNAWSLVHNTNADGRALFGMNRNTNGKFRVGERFRGETVKPVLIDFKIGDENPAVPFRIELSADQITMMRKFKDSLPQQRCCD